MADNIPNPSPALFGSVEPQPGMAQCSITKKWFPEDELVIFQGQRVSAEGKQTLLDRLQTGAEAPGALVRPGVAARFWCIFLDSLLLAVVGVIMEVAFGMRLWELNRYNKLESQWVGLLETTLEVSVYILYFGLLHGQKGKTIGKMIGGLRVVNSDGTQISKAKAFARAFVFQCGVILMLAFSILGKLAGHAPLANLGIFLSWAWMLLDSILALIDTRKQRSLHDRICGTRVVRENS
jgi:uncharacterized RDD family membrane protein YckC